MAQLVNLKQRIKAAETIKKITHAMQLVSMSNNLKLRGKKSFLDNYNREIRKLWALVSSQTNNKQLSFETASEPISEPKKPKNLVIILSSEKGLCGNFNNSLFGYYNSQKSGDGNSDIIVVGKEGIKHLGQEKIPTILNFPQFSSTNFNDIAKELSKFINDNISNYGKIIVYSNWAKSFFIQKQKKTVVYPIPEQTDNTQNTKNIGEYIWPQSATSLTSSLKKTIIRISITELLFDSLLAEQAARFISMDSSTRNASDLINIMKLEYNKLRQAEITKELTELTGSN